MQYKVFDKNFNILNTVTTELPYTVRRDPMTNSVTAEYQMNNVGNLFFMTNVSIDEKAQESEFGYLIGVINSENSSLNSRLLSFEKKKVNSLNIQIQDNALFAIGTCDNKGKGDLFKNELFSFKTDLDKLELIGEIIYNEIDESKITYSDCAMSAKNKSKYSKEEYVIKLMNCDLVISRVTKSADGGFFLVLRSCGIEGYDEMMSNLRWNHIVKLNKNGKIDWISSTDKRIQQYEVSEDGKGKYEVVFQETYNTDYFLFKIDEQKGVLDKKMIKNSYDRLAFYKINDVLYFVKEKNNSVNFGKFEFAE